MLYANHQGMFDVLAVAATCDIPVGAVLKKELYDIPFLHQVAICTRSFPMDREDVRQSLTVIQSVIREVKAGRNYLIFPEGTRSRNGNQMGHFYSRQLPLRHQEQMSHRPRGAGGQLQGAGSEGQQARYRPDSLSQAHLLGGIRQSEDHGAGRAGEGADRPGHRSPYREGIISLRYTESFR